MTIRFARASHVAAAAARAANLRCPTFCSPPRRPDAVRTIRHRRDGHAVVAIRLRGRTFSEVAVDIADGVCAANGLRGEAGIRMRAVLLDALEAGVGPLRAETEPTVPVAGPEPNLSGAPAVASESPARMAERHTQAA